MWWLAGLAAQASTFEIQVTDPLVTSVILKCRSGTFEQAPKAGVVAFEHLPDACQVYMVRKSGTIDTTGIWSCGLETCKHEEVRHAPVTDAPGRVNVIVTTALPPGAALELTCSNEFRVRADIQTNTAVFDAVPDEECTLFFKGTVPARYRPIRAGTWHCGLAGTTAVCTKQ